MVSLGPVALTGVEITALIEDDLRGAVGIALVTAALVFESAGYRALGT
jgi:hypothetical protein